MKRTLPCLLVTALLASPLAAQLAPITPPAPASRPATAPATQPAKIDSPWRYESAINRFAAADEKAMPAPGSVLFIGSSTFTRWNTKQYFPDLPVLNRAFGGSVQSDLIYFVDRIAYRYAPKVIVIYCGENDAVLKPEEVVIADFVRLIELLRAGCPQAKIIYLGLKPSPSRQDYWAKFQSINATIEQRAPALNVTFVSIWTALTTPDGEPRPELFVSDRLHNNDAGYALLKARIEPAIVKAYSGQ